MSVQRRQPAQAQAGTPSLSLSYMVSFVSWCSSEDILPLRIVAATTEMYIERGADWCGQGKNDYVFEGCGLSTCCWRIT